MNTSNFKIITPPTASSDIDLDLVSLTEFLSKKFGLDTSFGLGGEFGYGVDYENEVFMMHPFCWCDEDTCDWCGMNGKRFQKKLFKKYGDKGWAEWGYAPMFWYKPTNFQIRWYKWIGRDTEFNKKPSKKEWKEIYNNCIKSVL